MYTVAFVASGKTVAVFKVPHGGTVEAPRAPRIENDNLYSYEFVDWYPKNTVITGDMTYIASYSRTLLPQKSEEVQIGITPSVMRYVVLSSTAAALTLFGVIPSLIISFVAIAKSRKHSSKKKFTKKGKKA